MSLISEREQFLQCSNLVQYHARVQNHGSERPKLKSTQRPSPDLTSSINHSSQCFSLTVPLSRLSFFTTLLMPAAFAQKSTSQGSQNGQRPIHPSRCDICRLSEAGQSCKVRRTKSVMPIYPVNCCSCTNHRSTLCAYLPSSQLPLYADQPGPTAR